MNRPIGDPRMRTDVAGGGLSLSIDGMTAFHRHGWIFLCVALTLAFLCTTSGHAAEFYVTSHGWHTGIIVPRAAVIASKAWPAGVAERDFAGCAFLELGWGDRKFYMAKKPGVAMAVGAALVPGPSVLHVVGYPGTLTRKHVWNERVTVPCTDAELRALCRTLGAAFARDATGHAPPLGPGLYGFRSHFYAAKGHYWIGNTCNSWTLRMERAGGLPVRVGPMGTLRASAVIAQTQRMLLKR